MTQIVLPVGLDSELANTATHVRAHPCLKHSNGRVDVDIKVLLSLTGVFELLNGLVDACHALGPLMKVGGRLLLDLVEPGLAVRLSFVHQCEVLLSKPSCFIHFINAMLFNSLSHLVFVYLFDPILDCFVKVRRQLNILLGHSEILLLPNPLLSLLRLAGVWLVLTPFLSQTRIHEGKSVWFANRWNILREDASLEMNLCLPRL